MTFLATVFSSKPSFPLDTVEISVMMVPFCPTDTVVSIVSMVPFFEISALSILSSERMLSLPALFTVVRDDLVRSPSTVTVPLVSEIPMMFPLGSLITVLDDISVTEPDEVFSETDVVSLVDVEPSSPVLTSFSSVTVMFPSFVTVFDVSVLEPSSSMTSNSWYSGGIGSGLGVGDGSTGVFLDQCA